VESEMQEAGWFRY